MKTWFVVLLCFTVLLPLLVPPPTVAADKPLYPFRVPEEATIPDGPTGEMIRRGWLLVTDTPQEMSRDI